MIGQLETPDRAMQALRASRQEVELIGTDLRVSGTVELGGFHRLSDYVSLQTGPVVIHDARMLTRRGRPTADAFPYLAVRLADIDIIAQRFAWARQGNEEYQVEKVRRRIVAVLPGQILEGTLHMYLGADIDVFLQASDPPFLPLVDVQARWTSDRRLRSRWPFALVNRSQMVAFAAVDPR